MNVVVLAKQKPTARRLLIVEDEPRVVGRLDKLLRSDRDESIDFAATMEESLHKIEHFVYDAISVDWELGSIYCGPEILGAIGCSQPDVASIVLTKHHSIAEQAAAGGAVRCLAKGPSFVQYRKALDFGFRLTHARRIGRTMREVAPHCGELLDLSPCSFNENTEVALCRSARRAVVEGVRNGMPVQELSQQLKERGWWSGFDPLAFVSLGRWDKLLELWSYVEEDVAVMGRIVELDLAGEGQKCRGHGVGAEALPEVADMLMTVVHYVFRIADYNEDLMKHLWVARERFDGSNERPPWDRAGLRDYLLAEKSEGVRKCVLWIRGH